MLRYEGFQVMFGVFIDIAAINCTLDQRRCFAPVTRQMGGFSFDFLVRKFL